MASQVISPADRIRDLSAINAEVADLVKHAGRAVGTLTDKPFENHDGVNESHLKDEDKPSSLDDRKQAFEEHAKAYYSSLQAVSVRLRRQAYALEEAGIITSEAPKLTSKLTSNPLAGRSTGQKAGGASSEDSERITNGGLGKLDVGWLNSRTNKVGAEKERELIDEAKKLVEQALQERT